MLTEPKLEHRKERFYLAITTTVSMNEISNVLPPLIPEVFKWLEKNQITPDGPAFFRYLFMKNNELGVEVGFPVKDQEKGDGKVIGGSFPEGNYATLTYFGDYKNMKQAHSKLDSWVREKGWKEKGQVTENGVEMGARAEFYITAPQEEPNPEKWQTDILLLTDAS